MPTTLDPDTARQVAVALFNHVWDLLERSDRGPHDNDEMVHAAHASRYHWGRVGGPVNLARGEWQCSRVYSVLGRVEPALHHAHRCLDIATAHDLGPFDTGCGHEALARAYSVIGDLDAMVHHAAQAHALAAEIADAEDREILLADLSRLRVRSA